MKPAVWRLLAVTIGALLFIATVLNCYSALFANSDLAISGRPDPAHPDSFVITKIKDPHAIEGTVHPGDRAALEDNSLANRLRLLRGRAGERFVFAGTTPDGKPVRFVDTVQRTGPPGPAHWIYELMGVVFIVVGLLVAVRRPADPVARRLVALFLSLAAIIHPNGPWTPIWLTGFIVLGVGPFAQVFSAYAALSLAVTFPQPSARGIRRFLRRFNPWLLAATLAVEAVAIVLSVVLQRPTPRWLSMVATVETLAFFAAITVAFVVAIRGATGADKQRVRWVAYSLGIGFAGPLITFIVAVTTGRVEGPVAYLGFSLLAVPLGLGYAIVRHRVVDIGFVINRALVFGVISGVVIVAFMALEWTLSSVFVRVSKVTSTSLELMLALLLGFSLRGIHSRVDAFIDDLFFRSRHEAERALKTFAREVAYVTDPRVAVARAHGELVGRSGASDAAVYVVTGTEAVRVDPAESAAVDRVDVDDPALVRMRATRLPVALADVASAFAGDHAFPMCVRDTITGAVVLGAKTNGETYAPDEIATVETVVLALGNALDALQTAALKAEIARVLLDGAPVEALRRTVDPAAWVRGAVPQPAGSLPGLVE
ncbi:MAG TPA: hypothetical protein VGC72_01940 [Candidatus Elarobacter sp.]|jgi:hypothetical protein